MSFIARHQSIGGHSVYLHHQAPAVRPGFGVGSRRHDGRGRAARFGHGGLTLHPDGLRARRDQPHRSPDRRDGHRRGRRDRLRHRCLQPDRASPTLTSTALATSASSSTANHVNTTNSKVHQIGEKPFDGTQHGRAILYINGASGTISGNKVYDFQKNGIEVSGLNADASAPSSAKTSATVSNNVITGKGPIDYIAQNGIVIRSGASATVKDNTVSRLWYTPDGTEATGLLNYEAGKITVSGNKFIDTETRIDGAVTANVTGHSTKTIRPHGVRIDLYSDAKPAAQAVLGAKLDWKIKVDGSVRLHIQQGFSDHAVYYQHFGTGSGRHMVKVYMNGHLVRTVVARF